MIDQKKAAGTPPTPAAVSKVRSDTTHKAYVTLQAEFALTGRELIRCHRASDGRVSFVVRYRGESRHFTLLSDVQAHLSALVECH